MEISEAAAAVRTPGNIYVIRGIYVSQILRFAPSVGSMTFLFRGVDTCRHADAGAAAAGRGGGNISLRRDRSWVFLLHLGEESAEQLPPLEDRQQHGGLLRGLVSPRMH